MWLTSEDAGFDWDGAGGGGGGGGQVPSNRLNASRQLLYTVPVPPDSSSPLFAGASRQLLYTVAWLVVTLLLPVLLAKQVGSMDEEP